MKCLKKNHKISGVCIGVMVSAAFVVMVFSMHVAGTTEWASIIGDNEIAAAKRDIEIDHKPYQLALEDAHLITGLKSCSPETSACSVVDLIKSVQN